MYKTRVLTVGPASNTTGDTARQLPAHNEVIFAVLQILSVDEEGRATSIEVITTPK